MTSLARFMQQAGASWDLNPGHLESEPGSEMPLNDDPRGKWLALLSTAGSDRAGISTCLCLNPRPKHLA